MKNYNVRKRQFLELIYKSGGELTAREIEVLTNFKIGIKNIMVLLKRYHNFGYLHRKKNDNGVFVYSLNPTGEKKLIYLLKNKKANKKESEKIKPQIDLLVREPIKRLLD